MEHEPEGTGLSQSHRVLCAISPKRRLLPPALLMTFLLFLLCHIIPIASAQYRHSSSLSKNLASCYSDSDCDYSKTFLRCHNRVCRCSTIHHFDEETNRCLIRVGGSCIPGSRDQFCVAYATCHQRSKSSTTGECRCRSRYWENIDNLCVSGAALNIPYQYFLTLLTTATVFFNVFRYVVL